METGGSPAEHTNNANNKPMTIQRTNGRSNVAKAKAAKAKTKGVKKATKAAPPKKMNAAQQAAFSKRASEAINPASSTDPHAAPPQVIKHAAKKRADPKRQRKLKTVERKLAAPTSKTARVKTTAPEPAALAAKLEGPNPPIPATAEKNKHPERKASDPMVLQVGEHYRCYRDHQNRTCIRVFVGTKHVEFIPMDSAGVEVQKLSIDKFNDRFKQYDYPVRKAAELYAESSRYFGYTEKARRHLEVLLDGNSGLQPVAQPDEGEEVMQTQTTGSSKKKAPVKKAGKKKASPFAADKLIKKGNNGALAKARAARASGAASRYAGKKIKALAKETGARTGTARHAIRKAVMGCDTADKALAKTVTHEKVEYSITPKILENMVKLKLISIH
jgi:hypothetical protein